jgi:hypothetical protein
MRRRRGCTALVLLASTAGCGALEFPEGVLSDASYDRGTESLDAPELRDTVRFDTSRFDIGRFDTGRATRASTSTSVATRARHG